MSDNKIIKTKTIEELKNIILKSGCGFDANYVLSQAENEIGAIKDKKEIGPETFFYKSMTLFEFDKGPLLCTSVPERFSVFALEFSKKLQDEFKCVTASEKSLAEITSLNFIRTLWIQDRIKAYLGVGSITDMGVKYLDVLSRELDRAERHYQTSLQVLKMFKSPDIKVNIKTNTAVVGQNQAVQVKNT
ncbi:MAG: hypothetical protein ABH819_00710 [Patescibacteria group bacterium]